MSDSYTIKFPLELTAVGMYKVVPKNWLNAKHILSFHSVLCVPRVMVESSGAMAPKPLDATQFGFMHYPQTYFFIVMGIMDG